MNRRSLLDGEATPTQEHSDVFGDEFEVDDFDNVADGFRPNDRRDSTSSSRQDNVTDQPVRTVSAHYASSPATPTTSNVVSRNSTRKSRSYLNPFASPDDDDYARNERPQSLEFERDDMVRRSVSSASSHVYARTNSPRFGAGPSHPYGAYQQGTVARTNSVGTTSTVRAGPRQSYSQSRPQHPYALYPQGVDDELDDDDDDDTVQMRQNPVPVGFPGLGQNYTRRLGPDGEDQDIIGEDGHTEQLPPYTRYPEDGPEKMPLLPTALHSRAPVAGTDPGMPLMHTALQPPRTPQPAQSMSDESALERHASRASTAHLIPSSSRSDSEFDEKKPWKQKSWKERRKTKWCGVPAWWIWLATAVLVFMGAVLGGVIGGFVAGGNHARDQATVTVVTSLYDASLIASPTSAAPPTGTYALTLGQPEETQCACLPNKPQQVAWDCNLAPNNAIGIQITNPGNGNGTGANVFYASNDTTIAYGSQLSYMNTGFAEFLTVQDNDDKSNGPAFYFQQFYDKVVVVPEQAISTADSSKKSKRGAYPPGFIVPGQWTHRKQIATPGEKPWFCVWNGTFLEGFIYVQRPIINNNTNISTASTTSSGAVPSTPSPMTTPPPSTSSSGFTPSAPTAPPANMLTTTIAVPLTTATYTGPASAFGAWASEQIEDAKKRLYHGGDDQSSDQSSGQTQGQGGYHSKSKRQSGSDLWESLQLFPYIVKLEERRLPNNPQNPYCQQYQVLDSWSANWVADNTGNPIIIELNEQDPSFGAYESAGMADTTKRKRTVPGGCHCQWMSGE